MIKCEKCGCMLVLREGKFGTFAGCTNYPTCSNTMKIEIYKDKLSDILYDYFEKKGINIYCWDKECWKCL